MNDWLEWMNQTLSEDKSNFITAERNGKSWNFNRFTNNPFAAEITRLQSELAEARNKALDAAAEAVCGYIHPAYGKLPGDPFATDVVRALKSPKPPIL